MPYHNRKASDVSDDFYFITMETGFLLNLVPDEV